jgi:hypothetical protein
MHLVGELGPELSVPDSAGTIISNHDLVGAGPTPVGAAPGASGGFSMGDMHVHVYGSRPET